MPSVYGEIEYLSIVEAARYIGVNTRVLKMAIEDERLAAYQFRDGGNLYFLEEDLDAYLASCRVGKSASNA